MQLQLHLSAISTHGMSLLLHEPHCRVRCGVVEITEFTLGVMDMSGVIASLTGRTLTGESGLHVKLSSILLSSAAKNL